MFYFSKCFRNTCRCQFTQPASFKELQTLWQSSTVIQRTKQFLCQLLKARTDSYDFKMSDSVKCHPSYSTGTSGMNNSDSQGSNDHLSGLHSLRSASAQAMSGRVPLYSFGLIADVHYANIDDGTNHQKTRKRHYRNSLSHVKTAVGEWRAGLGTDRKISMVLDLGDLIDGNNAKHKSSITALKTVGDAFDAVGLPVIHVWGNHDLYNFTRKQLYSMPQMNPVLGGHVSLPTEASEYSMFFDVSLCPGYRLVVIDCYEISLLGVDDKSDAYRRAEKILRQENKNEELNSFMGLSGDKVRFVKFNGAVSSRQLQWLDRILQESQKRGEVVLVAGHIPLCSFDPTCICWNVVEILDVLHRYSCVLAYFAGHAHDGMYTRDDHGIHHLTIQGVIEVPPGAGAAHLNVHLYDDRVLVVDQRTEGVFEFQINKSQQLQ